MSELISLEKEGKVSYTVKTVELVKSDLPHIPCPEIITSVHLRVSKKALKRLEKIADNFGTLK